MGSPAAAEEGGEEMGGGGWEGGERSEVQARSTLTSTASYKVLKCQNKGAVLVPIAFLLIRPSRNQNQSIRNIIMKERKKIN